MPTLQRPRERRREVVGRRGQSKGKCGRWGQ